MSSNFKLVDDEMINAGKKISDELEKSQTILVRYLKMLEEVCGRGFIEGDTNKALLKFHNEIKSIFNNKLTEVGADVSLLSKRLVQDADRLDQDLYN